MKTLSGQRQSEIGGPIAIAEMTAHASKGGLGGMLGWIAVFSIMLGIMNLLPIPILDGGHLLFYAVEAIRGRPLDERKQEIGFRIGLAILATMMFAAIFGDIMRKLGIG
jgi:regulator of sigma E protease